MATNTSVLAATTRAATTRKEICDSNKASEAVVNSTLGSNSPGGVLKHTEAFKKLQTMTRQDRQLLLQDLCARVPYHPKGHVVNSCNGAECDEWLTCATFTMFTNIMNNTRLYLRQMSSMTEEEQKEFAKFHCVNICPIVITEELTISNETEMFDWLNKHHFDYRGLITKGLAVSTDVFNPYKD